YDACKSTRTVYENASSPGEQRSSRRPGVGVSAELPKIRPLTSDLCSMPVRSKTRCGELGLIGNFRFDQFGQKNERFLPAEVAHLSRNDVRHAFLHDVQFRPARDVLQGDRRLYLPW